ncbi:UNKNOWN [Stylonychia lemnae]|uniref:Uncharacterized protein n=1 Tax=Stylonychia lemnae TaxID=5949 RepID=A0A078BAI6_STYLE|nr:UNKNOWN [Stylonychia lemnae]|eukprot:CDW90578.1 UNKNOWN [Stylonychia lemnae]
MIFAAPLSRNNQLSQNEPKAEKLSFQVEDSYHPYSTEGRCISRKRINETYYQKADKTKNELAKYNHQDQVYHKTSYSVEILQQSMNKNILLQKSPRAQNLLIQKQTLDIPKQDQEKQNLIKLEDIGGKNFQGEYGQLSSRSDNSRQSTLPKRPETTLINLQKNKSILQQKPNLFGSVESKNNKPNQKNQSNNKNEMNQQLKIFEYDNINMEKMAQQRAKKNLSRLSSNEGRHSNMSNYKYRDFSPSKYEYEGWIPNLSLYKKLKLNYQKKQQQHFQPPEDFLKYIHQSSKSKDKQKQAFVFTGEGELNLIGQTSKKQQDMIKKLINKELQREEDQDIFSLRTLKVLVYSFSKLWSSDLMTSSQLNLRKLTDDTMPIKELYFDNKQQFENFCQKILAKSQPNNQKKTSTYLSPHRFTQSEIQIYKQSFGTERGKDDLSKRLSDVAISNVFKSRNNHQSNKTANNGDKDFSRSSKLSPQFRVSATSFSKHREELKFLSNGQTRNKSQNKLKINTVQTSVSFKSAFCNNTNKQTKSTINSPRGDQSKMCLAINQKSMRQNLSPNGLKTIENFSFSKKPIKRKNTTKQQEKGNGNIGDYFNIKPQESKNKIKFSMRNQNNKQNSAVKPQTSTDKFNPILYQRKQLMGYNKDLKPKASISSKNYFHNKSQSFQSSKDIQPALIHDSSSREIILYLDVNIGGGQMHELIIHQGDDVNEIVQQFNIKYNLNEKKSDKLLSVVQECMKKNLQKIDENEEDDLQEDGLEVDTNLELNSEFLVECHHEEQTGGDDESIIQFQASDFNYH